MAAERTTAIARRRRPRGRYAKTSDGAAPKREKRIPEYLEADEINAIIRAAPSPKAKLLMLEQSSSLTCPSNRWLADAHALTM